MAVKTPFFIAAAATLAHSLHPTQYKQPHSHNRHARVPHKTAHRMRTKPGTALHNHMHRIMLTGIPPST